MLSTEARFQAQQFNMRARQIFWRGILPDNHPLWNMDQDSAVDWICDFQTKNQLLCDGRFGPSSLIVFMANTLGGMGGFIIDGKEITIEGARVARMFTASPETKVEPDLCCLLSIPEIDYISRDRVNGKARIRAHFSIDSSEGPEHESLIIQWADPLREVPFSPVAETVDYPRKRHCIGIEIENVLLLYQLDSDERRWLRRRPVIKANIGKKLINQPIIYDAQIKALDHILDVLEKHAGIARTFPSQNGEYNTDLLESLDNYKGCLAKFNYFLMNNEPGAGLVPHLETLFGKLDEVSAELQESQADTSSAQAPDLSRFGAQKQELAQKKEPTASFIPTHEDGPRFNLTHAIAAAYASGKAARAGRIAEKVKKFDED